MRRFLASITISIILLLNISAANAAGIDANAIFNVAQLDNGVIKVACSFNTGKKLKVLVEKSDKRVSYNIKGDGMAESFPLQFGNGEYKVSVMENVEGDAYRYVTTEKVSLDLADQKKVYLASVQNVNWNDDMAAVKRARELTKDLKTDSEKIKAVYTYIVNNFTYDRDKLVNLPDDYLPDIDTMLMTKKGMCYDYASMFAAMLRSIGIPAKLVKGYSVNVKGYHAWNEVYDSGTGKWELIDTTYDSQMQAAKVMYAMVKKNSEYTKVNEY